MKKLLTDNFDKLVMVTIFFTILGFALIYQFDWLTTLARDAFLVLTALLGYRRQAQPVSAGTTETGDVNITPQDLTQPEAIGAFEVKEEGK